eukprot:INCI15064.8.p1 GENE.INCI15064.8~~INCI15064.8.p1  ORF type:complete len:773 (-),score=148.83 INCI15064.8:1316-3367(-)
MARQASRSTPFARQRAISSRRRTVDQLAQAMEEKLMAECTFQPRTNASKYFKKKRGGAGKNASAPSKHRLSQLANANLEREKRLHAARLEQESRFSKECTFKPKINKKSEKLLRRRRPTSYENGSSREGSSSSAAEEAEQERRRALAEQQSRTAQRLHQDAKKRALRKAQLKAQVEAEEAKMHPFQPMIVSAAAGKPAELSEKLRAEGYVPIQQRIGDLQRAKLEGLERIRREVDEENRDVLTFQPKVNKRTHKIIERARQAGDDPSTGQEQIASGADQNVGSRLNSYAERQRYHHLQTLMKYEEEQAKQCTFNPKIDDYSKRLVEGKPAFGGASGGGGADVAGDAGGGMSFVQRQEMNSKIAMENKRQIIRREQLYGEGRELTFKPSLNPRTDRILERTRPEIVAETVDERVQRMSSVEQKDRDEARAKAEREFYSKFDFKPHLRSNPDAVLRHRSDPTSTTVEQLHRNARGEEIVQKAIQRAEEEFARQHTFQPKVIKSTVQPRSALQVDLSNPATLTQAIAENDRIREERLERKRREIAEKEIAPCTFQPDIPDLPRAYQPTAKAKPIIVRGLGRHLELRAMAKSKQEEQAAREEKAFGIPQYNPLKEIRVPTVPKPFQLSSTPSRRREKQRAAARDAERAKFGECTFHPRTEHASHREMIDRILQEHDENDRTQEAHVN